MERLQFGKGARDVHSNALQPLLKLEMVVFYIHLRISNGLLSILLFSKVGLIT